MIHNMVLIWSKVLICDEMETLDSAEHIVVVW